MIYCTKLIGNELLKTDLAKEFSEMYKRFRKSSSDALQNFFSLNDSLSLQFDGLFCLFSCFVNKNPSEFNNIDGFKEFIDEKCAPLATFSNLIIFILNNYVIDDTIKSIIETPYDNLFDKNIVLNESKLKKGFESLLNSNMDKIFPLIISLRDKFFNSEVYRCYIAALKADKDTKKYERNIQALFYIIKQIIYQQIVDGEIKAINEDNMILYDTNHSIKGTFFEISYLPSNNLNLLLATDIVEIISKNGKELGYIQSVTNKFSQEKGFIKYIKGEILSENGLNMNSPTNDGIAKFLNKVGHWYKFIDPDFNIPK